MVVVNVLKLYFLVVYDRELIYINDGGEIVLDWVNKFGVSNLLIVLILLGLIGISYYNYIFYFVL